MRISDWSSDVCSSDLLNFWATWCPPCVKEMPDLEALHQKHRQAHFVGLAVDTAVNVRKFGEKVHVSYPLLIAGHGGIKLMRELGHKNGGLHFTVVFDKNGRKIGRASCRERVCQ